MLPSLLITFRETIEATLVIGIVLTILTKTNQLTFKKYVWQGILAGVSLSIILAFILEGLFGGLHGQVEEIFEGVLMFITAGFLTWMIMWIHQQQDIVKKIKEKTAKHVQQGYGLGILILVATSVFREGTETVLYLKASSLIGQSNLLSGAILGILTALILGYALFKWALKVNLSLLFNITSIFLLLFAAGLIAHGVHEFQEAGLLPIFSFDPIFNITHILDHKSVVGSFLRTLFGYTSKPTFLELTSYSLYIVFILWIQNFTKKIFSKNI